MKRKIMAIIGIISAMLIASVATVYAHSARESTQSDSDMSSIEHMDKMHDEMTEGLDKETKEMMDKMHESCSEHVEGKTGATSHMGEMMG